MMVLMYEENLRAKPAHTQIGQERESMKIKQMPSRLELAVMRAKHMEHTEFPDRIDRFGYLVTKCLPCKAEYITKVYCETCQDYIQQVRPNQTACPVCNS